MDMEEGFKLGRDIEAGTGTWSDEKPMKLARVGLISMWDCWVPEGMDEELVNGRVMDPGVVAKLREILPEAARRLWGLGFPSRRTRLVLAPRITEKNQITGGGVGGLASRDAHGMVVGLDSMNVATVIHEHAHMFWFTMGRAGKQMFIDHYKEAVGRASMNSVRKEFFLSDDKELMSRARREVLPRVADRLAFSAPAKEGEYPVFGLASDAFTNNIENLSKAIEEGRDDEAVLYAGLRERRIPARLKAEGEFYQSGDQRSLVRARAETGSKVRIWCNGEGGFLLELPREGGYLEHPGILSSKEVLEKVELDREEIRSTGLEPSLKKALKDARKSLLSLFGSKEVEGKAIDRFVEEMNEMSPGIRFAGLEHIGRRIFSSFKAMLRMRGRPEKDYRTHVQKAFSDAWEKNAGWSRAFLDPSGWEARQRADKAKADIGRPEGSGFRDFLKQSEGFPSGYSSANVDELWAETVQKAAMEGVRGINPKLKQLLVAAIHAG
jgi:hypothetical protein